MPALQPCDVICKQQTDGTPVLPPPEQLAYLLEYAGGFDREEAEAKAMEVYENKDIRFIHRIMSTRGGDRED